VRIDGASPSENDLLYLFLNIVLGGLDTVVSGIAFIVRYFAQHPQQYAEFGSGPDRIRLGLEELMRTHGVACTERSLSGDYEFHGVRFRQFDRIVIIPALLGIDPEVVERPLEVDLSRKRSPHMLFGVGPHICPGAHLARLEMKIFFEEWTRMIPQYAMAKDAPQTSIGGFVFQPRQVQLVWDPATTKEAA
jgi:cytochrome P450